MSGLKKKKKMLEDIVPENQPVQMVTKSQRQATIDAEVFKEAGIMGYQCGYCKAFMATSGAIESHHQKHHKKENEMIVYHMFDAREIQRLIRIQHYDKEVLKLQEQGLVDAEMKEVFPASKVQKNFKNKRDN